MAWYKHRESQLKIIPRETYDIKELSNNILCGWEINTKDQLTTLVTNLSLMDSEQIEKIEDKKLFLVDEEDFEAYYKMHEEKVAVEEISTVFSTLKKCSKHHFKNIYIRTLPVTQASIQQKKEDNEKQGKVFIHRDEDRVFIDDVMAIIPLVLSRQQNKNTKWTDKKLKTFYNQWKSGHEHVEASISIGEFAAALKELDCDKTQITLVSDPMHELSRKEVAEEFGFVRTCAPNFKSVMDGPQSIFFVFHYLVNGINWRNETCTEHEQCCKKLLKPRIMNLFYLIGSFKPGSYFSVSFLLDEMEKIRDLCPAKYRTPRETNDYVLQHIRASTHTHVEYYYRVVMEYNLVLLDVGLPCDDMNFFQVFSFRFLLQFGWIIQFMTEEEDSKLRLCLVHSALNLIPESFWQKAMEIAYTILAQAKSAWDKFRESGQKEESEESLMGALPGAPKNLRPNDRPAPGAPPPLYAPENCCATCKERLKETGRIQMNAMVVKEVCMPYEKELQKMPGLLEFSQNNIKKIEDLKRKIADKERNRKPTHVELKAKNEQLTKSLAIAKKRMEDFTSEKRILIDTSNSLKKTNEELMVKKGNLQSEASSRKENEPTIESVELQVPVEIQEKKKRIAELQNTQRNLLTIVESQSLYIQEMAK